MSTTVTDPRMRTNFIFASIYLIENKLARVRKYIIETYQVNGRLEPEEQYAVRVVDSRIRALHRSFLIQTRPKGDRDREMAEAEEHMARPDNGDLFRWRMSNHDFGRLGCNGCEYDYEQGNGLGMPRKVVLARVCPVCSRGVMHSQGVESATEALEGLLSFQRVVGVGKGPESSPRGAQLVPEGGFKGSGAVFFACEACGYWEVKP